MFKRNNVLTAAACLVVGFTSPVTAEVIHQERSLYRDIVVEDIDDVRCLKFNNKSKALTQSCMYKSDPQRLYFVYTKLLFSALLTIDDPQNVLVIGLGGGSMSNALHKIYPSIQIDNVEIDPSVVKVARDYFDFYESNDIKSYTQDGRIFIKRALLKKQQYDWVILDAYNGDYIPDHLLTEEFLQEAKSLLSPNGVLTANTFVSSQLYGHESATYQSVFGHFYNVRFDDNQNRVILVKNWETAQELEFSSPETTKKLQQRIAVLKDKVAPMDVDLQKLIQLFSSTKDAQDWDSNTRVLTDQYSPANLLNASN